MRQQQSDVPAAVCCCLLRPTGLGELIASQRHEVEHAVAHRLFLHAATFHSHAVDLFLRVSRQIMRDSARLPLTRRRPLDLLQYQHVMHQLAGSHVTAGVAPARVNARKHGLHTMWLQPT
jgi:hypothetical protein